MRQDKRFMQSRNIYTGETSATTKQNTFPPCTCNFCTYTKSKAVKCRYVRRYLSLRIRLSQLRKTQTSIRTPKPKTIRHRNINLVLLRYIGNIITLEPFIRIIKVQSRRHNILRIIISHPPHQTSEYENKTHLMYRQNRKQRLHRPRSS